MNSRKGIESPNMEAADRVESDIPTAPGLLIPADIHDAMSRTACASACGALRFARGIDALVSSFHPLRNTSASETHYNADPHDLIDAVVELRSPGSRDPGHLPLAPALGGRAEPDRPARELLRLGPPDHRLAARPGPRGPRLAARPRLVPGAPLEIVPSPEAGRSSGEVAVEPGRRPAKLLLSFPGPSRSDSGVAGSRPSLVREHHCSMQRTLIIFKPDCVQRRLVGPILARFEAKGLRIAAMKLVQVDRTRPRSTTASTRASRSSMA